MKKYFILVTFTLIFIQFLKAQTSNDILIFSQEGEKFTVSANGNQQNTEPLTQVKISNFELTKCLLIVTLEDGTVITRNLIFPGRGSLISFLVKKTKKGEYVLRPQGEEALNTENTVNTTACTSPLPDADFLNMKAKIQEKVFEAEKLQLAKEFTKGNCLRSSQIKEILKIFEFESSRLEFAKFAYQYTYDKSLYKTIYDAFQFGTSEMEINSFIENK